MVDEAPAPFFGSSLTREHSNIWLSGGNTVGKVPKKMLT
jgi:hypothetical protein